MAEKENNKNESSFIIRGNYRPVNADYLLQAAAMLEISFRIEPTPREWEHYMEGDVSIEIYTRNQKEVEEFWVMHKKILDDPTDIIGPYLNENNIF